MIKMGNKIASRRKELGMTQQELADKLYISVKTVSKWETNRGNPEMNILPQLADALELRVTDLFEDVETGPESLAAAPSKKTDVFNACFAFGAAFLGLLFFALKFIVLEANLGDVWPWPGSGTISVKVTGYKMLTGLDAEGVLGMVLILAIWTAFLSIFAHIALGVLEFVNLKIESYRKKKKAELVLAIVSAAAIIIALILLLIASAKIGAGIVMMFLLNGGVLIYRIYEHKKKRNLSVL